MFIECTEFVHSWKFVCIECTKLNTFFKNLYTLNVENREHYLKNCLHWIVQNCVHLKKKFCVYEIYKNCVHSYKIMYTKCKVNCLHSLKICLH